MRNKTITCNDAHPDDQLGAFPKTSRGWTIGLLAIGLMPIGFCSTRAGTYWPSRDPFADRAA